MKRFSSLFIILAGTLWGMMGIFVKEMSSIGFSSQQTACIRVTVAALAMSLMLLLTDRKKFKVNLKDIHLFATLGIICIFGMSLLYFYTIVHTSLSVAAILLYTSPIWVIIISAVFLREKITWQKMLAMITAFLGCVMVSGLGDVDGIPIAFFITGMGSGLAYGLYSIFGAMALRKYHPYTVTTYAFIFAAISSWLVSGPNKIIEISTVYPDKLHLFIMIIATGLITAFAPYMLYTCGLKGTSAGKGAIMACAEPLVATVVGLFLYKQSTSVIGIILILLAILIVNNFGITKK